MLRRTLALELAYRPGGVLASKIHLKHVAVATTEGYAKARELRWMGVTYADLKPGTVIGGSFRRSRTAF
jgi:hypothetical protein